jgi:hypothetical protein
MLFVLPSIAIPCHGVSGARRGKGRRRSARSGHRCPDPGSKAEKTNSHRFARKLYSRLLFIIRGHHLVQINRLARRLAGRRHYRQRRRRPMAAAPAYPAQVGTQTHRHHHAGRKTGRPVEASDERDRLDRRLLGVVRVARWPDRHQSSLRLRAIQRNSTPEHNYIANGYLAKDRASELAGGPTLQVYVTEKVENVTDRVLKGLSPSMPGRERHEEVQARIKALTAECETDKAYRCSVPASTAASSTTASAR